jgi:hypothetical protein
VPFALDVAAPVVAEPAPVPEEVVRLCGFVWPAVDWLPLPDPLVQLGDDAPDESICWGCAEYPVDLALALTPQWAAVVSWLLDPAHAWPVEAPALPPF